MQEKQTSETTLRSITKLGSFKVAEVITSAFIVWIATSSYLYTFGLPLLIEGIQAVVIFIIERIWTHIQWGKECKNCHYYCIHEKMKAEGKPHD